MPPMNEEEKRNAEAWETGDMIRNAASLAENAMKIDDKTSQNALRNAAKALLNAAIAKMDESVGAEEDDE